jgi:hypothetical protein
MRYCVAFWSHKFEDEPIWLLYEVSGNGDVVRMIEYYRHDLSRCRSALAEGLSSLVDVPFSFSDTDFKSTEVFSFETTPDDFSRAWEEYASRDINP